MDSKSFIYWLQGFFEISEAKELNQKQVEIIRNHLNMVFIHDIDPKMGDEEHQDLLNKAHVGKADPLYDMERFKNEVYKC